MLAVTAPAAVVPLALSPLAEPLLRWLLPEYVDAATIAPAVAVQAGIYLLQVPFTPRCGACSGRGRSSCSTALFTTVSLTGLVTGAATAGLVGAAWGLPPAPRWASC